MRKIKYTYSYVLMNFEKSILLFITFIYIYTFVKILYRKRKKELIIRAQQMNTISNKLMRN